MSRFSRIQVALKMQETGLVPLLYHNDIGICKDILKACYNGGVRCFEFTNRGDFAHEILTELSKFCIHDLPEMILGIGSVLDSSTAALYIQSGANFVVSPVFNPEIAKVCNRRKILWIPGCGTLTEISLAEESGAEIIKIFPATEVGGSSFVSAIKAPCPWTSIMATGGVDPTEESLKQWFSAGVDCVGIGSKLITKKMIETRDFEQLTNIVKKAIGIINKYKNNK